MAMISVLNVHVKNNPSKFTDPFIFDITFESLTNLKNDIDWKVVYICSQGIKTRVIQESNNSSSTNTNNADNTDYELDCISLGPITKGTLSFQFQVNPPNYEILPLDSILGIQAVVITGSYNGNEFIRIGYYVNNQYMDKELIQIPPPYPVIDKILRYVISDSPRVTRFPIMWDNQYEDDLPLIEEENENEFKVKMNNISKDENFSCEDRENINFQQIQNINSNNNCTIEFVAKDVEKCGLAVESNNLMNSSAITADNDISMI